MLESRKLVAYSLGDTFKKQGWPTPAYIITRSVVGSQEMVSNLIILLSAH